MRLKGGCHENIGKLLGRKAQVPNSRHPSGNLSGKYPRNCTANFLLQPIMDELHACTCCVIPSYFFPIQNSMIPISSNTCRNLIYLGKLFMDSGFTNNAGIILRKCS